MVECWPKSVVFGNWRDPQARVEIDCGYYFSIHMIEIVSIVLTIWPGYLFSKYLTKLTVFTMKQSTEFI